jgi:MFS family permease
MSERQTTNASWMPLFVIILAQISLNFNLSTLQVSVDGIASSFNRPATTVGTAIVAYSLVVAGFLMVGARIAGMHGGRSVFRAALVVFAGAVTLMAFSPSAVTMIVAQVTAGAAAAVLIPTFVVLVAAYYTGRQRAKALAFLAAAQPMGIVLSFLVAGFLGTWLGWRYTFGLLALVAVTVYLLSTRLSQVEREAGASIDPVGALLMAASIFLISIGCNNLGPWGTLLARPQAPFKVLNLSPAPMMIVCGIVAFQAFLVWSRRRVAAGRKPLIALEVIGTSQERAVLFSLFAIMAITGAISFLVPLYIQIVQGGTSWQTAVALIPLSMARVAAAIFVVRLFDRISPRRISRFAFLLATLGVALLGIVIRNEWSNGIVILCLILLGVGEGTLAALLFNVFVSAFPKEKAGDVGSLRGTANNLGTGVGTALAGALLISVLGTRINRDVAKNPQLTEELKTQVNLDKVTFISNDRLRDILERTTATPEQVTDAVRLNTEARLVALKVSIFSLAGLALLAYFPAGALPRRLLSQGQANPAGT